MEINQTRNWLKEQKLKLCKVQEVQKIEPINKNHKQKLEEDKKNKTFQEMFEKEIEKGKKAK